LSASLLSNYNVIQNIDYWYLITILHQTCINPVKAKSKSTILKSPSPCKIYKTESESMSAYTQSSAN